MSLLPRFPVHPWKITEAAFRPADYRLIEALFALSNGYLGQRASFEEGPGACEGLPGNYVAGVFDAYSVQTMIKLKGRPAEPRQMVNILDHLPVEVVVDGKPLRLTDCTVETYERTLHMDRGILTRDVTLRTAGGQRLSLSFSRFLSRARKHIGATRIRLTPLNFNGVVEFVSMIGGNVRNASGATHVKNVEFARDDASGMHGLSCETTKTAIRMAVLASGTVHGVRARATFEEDTSARVSRCRHICNVRDGEAVTLEKVVAVATSRDFENTALRTSCAGLLDEACRKGWDALLEEHEGVWRRIWDGVEMEIVEKSGAGALTQGLHYSIFQMMQNAPNDDPTVNIGAKGLTGEHYFGTYFWDTEVFMLPMFAFTEPSVARDLIRSRVTMLPGARAKAAELGVKGAMFPFMSDADGNESSTLWQFALMGIHVTADVAWGVWFYYCVTGDLETVAAGGIDILVETSRFWLSRVFYRKDLDRYVINRVLGPDEYHQGVDNNFYTNIMAQENLLKTVRLLDILRSEDPDAYATAVKRLGLAPDEVLEFQRVAERIYLPCDGQARVHLQDDRFHLLEPWDLKANPVGVSLVQAWSYDRLMRTQLLRQGDVIVANLLLGDRFSEEEIRRDFEYYEPRTTHDSSLSFCHHAVLAAQLRKGGMAYDYFLRTARLDLDDIHGNSWMGVHTACLAGAWQCVALGFGGVRWYDGQLVLNPCLPAEWQSYTFSIGWHGARLKISVRDGEVELQSNGREIELLLGKDRLLVGAAPLTLNYATRLR